MSKIKRRSRWPAPAAWDWLLSAAIAFGVAVQAPAQQVAVQERVLANGMKVLTVERHDEPSVAAGWVAHVGSANERPGITGIAHLFEHMMFKGTTTVGTKDAARDQEIIAEQERVRDAIRQEDSKMRAAFRRGEISDVLKPENKTERLKELEARFKILIDQQRDILVKNEFDKIYTAAGGSGMNAFTSADTTGYFITLPANKLELWMWMESERLLRPVFREFYAERDVVFEERRMRSESTPLGKFAESFEALFWGSHPYGWPTLGLPSDIMAISKADADEFFGIYYSPQNITLILVGDLKPEETARWIDAYFGRIPRGRVDPPDLVPMPMPQPAEKRMYAEAETNPQVDIYWHTVPFGHRDSYPLMVLAQVLSTRTGRLHKGLVLGSQVATETFAGQYSQKWAGVFNAGGQAREGKSPEDVEQGIHAEIERLKTEDLPQDELQKVKNNFAASEYRRLSSNFAVLYQLIQTEGNGEWREINEAGKKLQAVTAADVKRAANQYFKKETRAVGIYTRKPGAPAGGDAEEASLSPEQKPIMMKIASQIEAETNAGKLRQMLQDVEQRLGAADGKSKPFLSLYRKKLAARIEAIEKPATGDK